MDGSTEGKYKAQKVRRSEDNEGSSTYAYSLLPLLRNRSVEGATPKCSSTGMPYITSAKSRMRRNGQIRTKFCAPAQQR